MSLEKIKSIIEPLLNDENSAEIIEQLSSVSFEDDSEKINQAIAERDAHWNQRFRNTFMQGVQEEDVKEVEVEVDDEVVGDEEVNLEFDDLFEREDE